MLVVLPIRPGAAPDPASFGEGGVAGVACEDHAFEALGSVGVGLGSRGQNEVAFDVRVVKRIDIDG